MDSYWRFPLFSNDSNLNEDVDGKIAREEEEELWKTKVLLKALS